MFMVEWRSGGFVDAERIVSIDLGGEVVWFWLDNDSGGFKVDPEFTDSFLNSLQVVNQNKVNNIESRYYELNPNTTMATS